MYLYLLLLSRTSSLSTLLPSLSDNIIDYRCPKHLFILPTLKKRLCPEHSLPFSCPPTEDDLPMCCNSVQSHKNTAALGAPTNCLFSQIKRSRSYIEQLPAVGSLKLSCSLTSHLAPEWLMPSTRWMPEGNASFFTPQSPTRHHIGNYILGAGI